MTSELILTFVLDVFLAFLLLITIFFCSKLSKRIRVLQDSKSELGQLIRQFDESTEKASASIIAIQNASKKITENIQTKLDKANYLADDLQFMIEKGSKLADNMESGISANRSQRQSERTISAEPRGAAQPQGRGRAQPEIADEPQPAPNVKRGSSAGLESMLDRVANRNAGAAANPAQEDGKKPMRPNLRMRSKAEQELYDAIKSNKS